MGWGAGGVYHSQGTGESKTKNSTVALFAKDESRRDKITQISSDSGAGLARAWPRTGPELARICRMLFRSGPDAFQKSAVIGECHGRLEFYGKHNLINLIGIIKEDLLPRLSQH